MSHFFYVCYNARMVKKFKIKQKLWIYILTCALLIILCASSIVNLLALCEVGNFNSQFPPLDIVATIIMILVAITLTYFVFFSRYVVDQNGITRYIGFLKEQVNYEDIYLVRVDSKKTMLLLYVKADDDQKAQIKDEDSKLYANLVQIFISKEMVDDFINAVKENSKELAFEILPSEEK